MWALLRRQPEFASPDNLKAGVLKADLWDPQINRALGEAADHYGVFIDPCRVALSTDKGKIERFVPVARELFRRLIALHVDTPLRELNEHARHWWRHEYGRAEHRTTGVAPMEAFAQERTVLKTLPDQRFETPVWRRGQCACRRPVRELRHDALLGTAGVARTHGVGVLCAPLLRLFDDQERLIRQYVVEPGKRLYWVDEDFPAEVRQMIDRGYPAWILEQGRHYDQIRSGGRGVAGLGAAAARVSERPAGARNGWRSWTSIPAGGTSMEVCRRAKRRSVVLPQTLRRMLEGAANEPMFRTDLKRSKLG